ncbi:hypothetical protein SS50377_24846 [Spironucleus salmonicida]|uniref:Uncharacterized protein n=1 Tax=Spironucleus salmonicida TaxID=348837 RepID=V6LQH1_9EUKA|nr:hypothetical protein SS50377_24829 [Spironucleus salmonicida]KAH0572733.1 hypothetical protein SS50377_24846 [Spironucleus salmonicida]|eukprot:EST46830.1 Hypothetical protein SS50377_13160 [Spironucleus salmonicida]
MSLEDFLKEQNFVSVNLLRREIGEDKTNQLLEAPQMPYLSLQFVNKKASLVFNKGPVYAFLTDDAFDYDIEVLFEEIVKFDALYSQRADCPQHRKQVAQENLPKETVEPEQKVIDTAEDAYVIQRQTKINDQGVIATTKVEKKVQKQSSIMGFLKKK